MDTTEWGWRNRRRMEGEKLLIQSIFLLLRLRKWGRDGGCTFGIHSIRIFVFGNGRIMLLDTFCPLSLSISDYTGKMMLK